MEAKHMTESGGAPARRLLTAIEYTRNYGNYASREGLLAEPAKGSEWDKKWCCSGFA